jgi:hypothetical protein
LKTSHTIKRAASVAAPSIDAGLIYSAKIALPKIFFLQHGELHHSRAGRAPLSLWIQATGNLAWFASQPRRRPMTSKWKPVTIFTIATIAIASPAFAQSFDPDEGTGNLSPLVYQGAGSHDQTVIRQNGFDAFAMAPRTKIPNVSDLPERTGGGSLGYNEELGIQP